MDGIGAQERNRNPDECGQHGNEQAVLDRHQVIITRKNGRKITERNASCSGFQKTVDEDVG
ncbi:hypothetical protein SDC9_144507 [bioreactor metagenome]|uniref:Uncharacterized protein n=1 Tax=bioreactor metagenome TaxID=1076179 RepID=A0A645E694_9ZZZZ